MKRRMGLQFHACPGLFCLSCLAGAVQAVVAYKLIDAGLAPWNAVTVTHDSLSLTV